MCVCVNLITANAVSVSLAFALVKTHSEQHTACNNSIAEMLSFLFIIATDASER